MLSVHYFTYKLTTRNIRLTTYINTLGAKFTTMTSNSDAPPSAATEAVLVKSEEMPADAQKVEELDFNKFKGPITAENLFEGMRHMGFQASSMCEAVRIINDMVRFDSETLY